MTEGINFALRYYSRQGNWFKKALLQTFGKETFSDDPNQRPRPIPSKAYLEELGVLNTNDESVTEVEHLGDPTFGQYNVYALQKILNPFKLFIQLPLSLFYYGLETLTLYGLPHPAGTIDSSTDLWAFRIIARLTVFVLVGIPYRVACWFTSPLNEVFYPFFRFLQGIWNTGIWGFNDTLTKQIGAIGLLLITLAVITFCLASVFTGGIFPGVVFLGVMSSTLASLLPVFTSALATIASSLAISSVLPASAVTITATLLAVSTYVVACTAIIQRFFEGIFPAVLDFWFIKEGGYSKDQHMIVAATMEVETFSQHSKKQKNMKKNTVPEDTQPYKVADATKSTSQYARSSAMGFLLFNGPLGIFKANDDGLRYNTSSYKFVPYGSSEVKGFDSNDGRRNLENNQELGTPNVVKIMKSPTF